MNTEILIDAIGKIDASYVEEAELWQAASRLTRSRKKTSRLTRSREKASWLTLTWKRTLATAACFVLLAAGLVAALRNLNHENLTGGADTGGLYSNDAGAAKEGADADAAEEGIADGAAKEGAVDGISEEQVSETAEIPPQDSSGGETDYACQQGTDLETERDNGNVKETLLAAFENTEAVTVTYHGSGAETAYTLRGADLKALREWTGNLTLGVEVTFEEGAYPGQNEEGGELYYFEAVKEDGEGQEVFSYRIFNDCYIVVNDTWYPVLNPEYPPIG